jgi:prevent-host-death family protein
MRIIQPIASDRVSFPVHELKSALSSVLARVQAGTEAVITSHRKPIAKIVPYAAGHDQDIGSVHKISGVKWSAQKFTIAPDFQPIRLKGEGLTVSEILIAQR